MGLRSRAKWNLGLSRARPGGSQLEQQGQLWPRQGLQSWFRELVPQQAPQRVRQLSAQEQGQPLESQWSRALSRELGQFRQRERSQQGRSQRACPQRGLLRPWSL
ncbi:hypothetical protein BJX64DRAFT_251324 [Aspergillus heterothallicus]